MIRKALLAMFAAAAASPLTAAPLTVRIVDAAGHSVSDAVVTFKPASGGKPARGGGGYTMAQKGMQFHPFVLVVPAGASVSFPNQDSTKHDVYSFSPAKTFELKLFAKDETRSVRFDKPGVVALGCNIHDEMTAFIFVTDTAWTAKTDRRGVATFGDAPAAPGRLSVWHPYLKAPGNTLAKAIPAGDSAETFKVALRPPPMAMPAY